MGGVTATEMARRRARLRTSEYFRVSVSAGKTGVNAEQRRQGDRPDLPNVPQERSEPFHQGRCQGNHFLGDAQQRVGVGLLFLGIRPVLLLRMVRFSTHPLVQPAPLAPNVN